MTQPILQPSIDHRVHMETIASQTLGITKRFFVYLPPEYSQPERRFPVLYLLRGHEREWVSPHEDLSRQGTTVVDVYERLRADGQVGPLLLVMPGLSSDDNRFSGVLTDFHAPELARDVPGIGTGRFEHYFFSELVPAVDQRFRTVPAARAVAGFSLGGLMAAKAAIRHPHQFVSVGAYDGTFFYATDDGHEVRADDGVLRNPLFDPVFGLPRNPAALAANSPANLLHHADPEALRRLTWLIQYGPESAEPWHSNFYRGEHFVELLRQRGIANAVPPVVADGQHTWAIADRHIAETLPLHWQAMQHAL